MKMWVVDIRKVCAFFCAVLLPNMALAVTCPSGYSEFSIDDGHIVVPLSERCPDGYSQIYTVDDCTDADMGSVCAVCDSDYLLGGFGKCVELCSTDKKTIRFSNDLSFNLLKSPSTKPALNILMEQQQCYIDLATGNAPGLNFELPSGATYHAVQNDGGYRVCAPGYTLSYDCGIGGGTAPESQTLLNGYWYTVPPNADSCTVPDGMRFTGWYMDGAKRAPYVIHTYNYDVDTVLTAMFADASKVSINYFCDTTNSSPVYTDMVVIGESVTPKTNMCPYEPKEVGPFAWIEPFSQDEIDQLIALSGGDLSDLSELGFFRPYLGMGKSALASEGEFFVLLLIMSAYENCINDSEYASENPEACALGKLLVEHTKFDPAMHADLDITGVPAELLALLFIVPDADVNLTPLYIPTEYNMTWDCGKHFRVSGGYDFNGSTRYGWTVRYGCSAPERGGYDYSPAYGMTFVGWDVDGVFYEGTDLTYKWTEDKTATGIFDYNLNANFDCGTDGVLTSGDATLTYSGRGAADMYIPLNINAQCAANAGKKFVGWQIDGVATVYNVGDTLNWVDSVVAANSNCDFYYGDLCDELIFTAVYEDVPAGKVNYYCSVDDTVPAFVEQMFVGASVDVKTNMCTFDVKTTETLGWVGKFSGEEINNITALLSAAGLADTYKNFITNVYIDGKNSIDNDTELMFLAWIYSLGKDCVQNTETQTNNPELCELMQLLYYNTYFETPDTVGAEYYKQIYSEEDINLRPLYIGAKYNINYDCGKYFEPGAGDLNDVAWTARYGWDKTYYCVDLNGQDYSFDVGECVDFDANGYCTGKTAIDMVGWQIDGQEYPHTINYIWTEDKNALAIFDYNLSATFDCGDGGALESGDDSITYTGHGISSDEISLNITANCISNAEKVFIGWRLKNNDTEYQVGDTLNWLDVFLDANNCDSYYSSCRKLTFEAMYKFVEGIKYYCEHDSSVEQYDYFQDFYGDPVTVLEPTCTPPYVGATHVAWYTPFSDDEIAQLNAIVPYENLSAESQKFVAPFMGYTDIIDANGYVFQFALGVSGAVLLPESSEYNTLFIDLAKQHMYGTEYNSSVSELMPLYAMYVYIPLEPKYNTGNISVFNRGMDGMFSFLEWPYYGQEYPLQKFSPVTCNSDIDIVGYEHGGNIYGTDETISWLYTESIEFNVLFDLNITSRFDCGSDGVLQDANMAEKIYTADGVTGDMALDLTLDAVCVPNPGKKFVGWNLSNAYYHGGVVTTGTVLNLWDELHYRNPNLGLLDDARHCPAGYDNGLFEFIAVYEDVVDVNWYCSGADSLPTYAAKYSTDTTSVALRTSGCSYDAKKYELYGWYTPFTADETATLKGYSFDTKYPDIWNVVESLFVNQTSDYVLDRDVLFTMSALWAGYSSTDNDAGLKYLATLLQKHWFIKGYSSSISIDGNTNLYAFYTGKLYSVNFDCGNGEYSFWDDFNTGYYGATQKWCDSCGLDGATFAGWSVDGVFHEQCEPFVWTWTQNMTATGIYDYDMTANFDCGTDGVYASGDTTVKNVASGDSTTAIPLNITATCTPNAEKRFVGWANGGKTYSVGQTLNWLDYLGESVVEFTAVYEDVIDINYYCDAANTTPTYIDKYSTDTTSVTLRTSGCEYDSDLYSFFAWFTPFTDEEVANLKSYSFHTKHKDLWAVVEPTFVNHTSSYAYDYDTVFILAALYAGRGSSTNDDGVKYLTELLQKHWFIVSENPILTVTDSANLYAFYYKW